MSNTETVIQNAKEPVIVNVDTNVFELNKRLTELEIRYNKLEEDYDKLKEFSLEWIKNLINRTNK